MKQWIQKPLTAILLLILLCTGYSITAVAQSGNGHVKGQITDADGGPLPGASILIKGTNQGVTSDLAGNFTFLNITPGKHVLVANYMGFKPMEIEVMVKNGETVNTKVKLSSNVASLRNVTISSFREGQQ